MEQVNQLSSKLIKSNSAVVADIDGTLNIFVGDDRGHWRHTWDIPLENVTIKIQDNGNMHLTGERIEYDYFDYPEDYEELKEKDYYVLHDGRVKQRKFLWWNFGKPIYTSGWVQIKKRRPYEVTTSNYRITGI